MHLENKKENQKTLQIRMIRSQTVSWINRFVAIFFHLPVAVLARSFHSLEFERDKGFMISALTV